MDPDLLAKVKAFNLERDPTPGTEPQHTVQRIMSQPLTVITRLERLLENSQPRHCFGGVSRMYLGWPLPGARLIRSHEGVALALLGMSAEAHANSHRRTALRFCGFDIQLEYVVR